MSRALARLGLTRKRKVLSACEQDPVERAWYGELIEALNREFHRLIFIDESAINTDLVLRYGRAPNGERV